MEKSRAIELLKLAVPIKALTQQEYSDFVEAVNMGMDALEQPTSPDTIDRKAALDALRRCQTYLYDALDPELKIKLSSAKAAINNLPTIQPEKAQLSKEGTTKDAISRQAAIDECNKRGAEHIGYAIAHLPPIQPEPQWIPVSERLPETEEFVLASLTGKYRNITFEHACEIADYADGEWCVYAYPHMSAEKCEELIEAWMPLPEAYKPNK